MNIPSKNSIYIFSAGAAFTAYFGAINPYHLGMLSSLAFAFTLVVVCLLIKLILARTTILARLLISLVFIIATAITIANWYYYDYFGAYFTYEIFALGTDIFSGFQAVNFSNHVTASASLILILVGCLVILWRGSWGPKPNKLPIIFCSLISVVGLIITNQSNTLYQARGNTWLVPENLHPLHAFFLVNSDSDSVSPSEIRAAEYFSAINSSRTNTGRSTLEHHIKRTDKNVIVLMLESFRADLTGVYGNTTLTPSFDNLAQKSMLAEQHFSNTTHTVSAEVNLWCGLLDLLGETKLAYLERSSFSFDCLPSVLSKQGFQTLYVHGNTGDFYHRNELLPKLGFKELYFHKDRVKKIATKEKIGWGINDVAMFDLLLKKVENASKSSPVFAHFTSISNHYPFHWQVNDPDFVPPFSDISGANSLLDNYKNMITYTDYALGKFWNKFAASDLAKNTIVVVTSDHGIWEFANNQASLLERNERFFRSPLIIYDPENSIPSRYRDVSSHIDIAPTLLTMLGLAAPKTMLGRSLLQNYEQANFVISDRNRDTIYRTKEAVCYIDIDECKMRQLDCKPSRGEIFLTGKPADLKVCYSLKGDPLSKHLLRKNISLVSEYQLVRDYRSLLEKQLLNNGQKQ